MNCYDVPWTNEVNGLWWAWASPCAGGCGQLSEWPLPWGWRWATDDEFIAFRDDFDVDLWTNPTVCAAPYFQDVGETQLTECDVDQVTNEWFTHIEFPRKTEWDLKVKGVHANDYELFLVHDLDVSCFGKVSYFLFFSLPPSLPLHATVPHSSEGPV